MTAHGTDESSVMLAHSTTEAGRAALDAAIEEARRRGAVLHLVTWTQPSLSVSTTRPNPPLPAEPEDDTPDSEVSGYVDLARERGVAVEVHQRPGSASLAEAVLDVAGTVRPTLIVVGVRRRSRVGKLVLGSDAQDLLLHADCAVLAVKSPLGE